MWHLQSSMLLSLSLVASTSAFLTQFKPIETLKDIAKIHQGIKFDVRLDIGDKQDAHLFLDGLALELTGDRRGGGGGGGGIKKKTQPVQQKTAPLLKMPGANGSYPQVSSGVYNIHVASKPFFVDMTGRQHLDMQDGCWEVVWRDTASSGVLVCGFQVPHGAKRNKASLSPGRMYMSFPLWTHESLAEDQARKFETESRAREHIAKKNEELGKMQQTNNLFMKAMHYRNAAEAVELYSLTRFPNLDHIPDRPDQVLPLPRSGYVMAAQGTVWSDNGLRRHILGAATLKLAGDSGEPQPALLAP